MRDSTSLARTLLACLLAALWLTASATAWRMHEAGHLFTAPGQQRSDAAIAQREEAPPSDSCADCAHGEDGHDHLTSVLAGMSAVIPESGFVPVLLERPAVPRPALVRVPAGSADPPPPRPPRFA